MTLKEYAKKINGLAEKYPDLLVIEDNHEYGAHEVEVTEGPYLGCYKEESAHQGTFFSVDEFKLFGLNKKTDLNAISIN